MKGDDAFFARMKRDPSWRDYYMRGYHAHERGEPLDGSGHRRGSWPLAWWALGWTRALLHQGLPSWHEDWLAKHG